MAVTTLEVDVEVEVTRDDLVISNLALAHKIAYDYLARAPRHTDRDDIVSAAMFGLVEAAGRYDAGRGIPFPQWASARVYGAVVDAARSVDPLTRSVRSGVRALDKVESVLAQQLGARPGEAEVAAAAGMSTDTVRKLRNELHRGVVKSLDETTPGGVDTYAATLVDADPSPLETLERRELDAYLVDAVAMLPERHRDVVVGLFLRGETNAEVGERLGVTPQRISQLRGEALRMLRSGMASQFDGTDLTVPLAEMAQARARALPAQASYAAAISARRTYTQRLTGTL